jgi:predicted RNA binding protein YcfA (HicA-like mRNA interferase family)
VSKPDKTKQDVLSGTQNKNIRFDELCALVVSLGFRERTKGSHRIYSKTGIRDIINLQPGDSGKAKSYQVRQVAALIQQNNL